MAIREFFHLIHIVDNEDEADAWYDEVFAPMRFSEKHWMDSEKRWASLSMVSDLMIEVIEPSSAEEDQVMPLPKFRNRFGQHYHSLSWYVEPGTIKPLFDSLRALGVRIAKPGGGMFPEGDIDPGPVMFTHPKDTYGQIEFMDVGRHWLEYDPRFQEGWSTAPWADEHPLGIQRVSHFTTGVNDLDRARSLFVDALGGKVLHAETGQMKDSVYVWVGNDSVVELAKPLAFGTRLADDLAANGELPHACTFTVRDLDAAERHIDKVGVRVADRDGDTFTLDPADCFGAVYAFTSGSVPGDPRT